MGASSMIHPAHVGRPMQFICAHYAVVRCLGQSADDAAAGSRIPTGPKMKADSQSHNLPAHREEGWTYADWAVSKSGRSHRSRHGNAAANQTASSANILIVDDDPKSLMAAEAAVTDMGLKLVLAGSGEE